jgi:hypothetical protein
MPPKLEIFMLSWTQITDVNMGMWHKKVMRGGIAMVGPDTHSWVYSSLSLLRYMVLGPWPYQRVWHYQ